jgi:CRP-like cAMP-binding protein
VTTAHDIQHAFAAVPLLAGLTARQRAAIAARATTRRYAPGSTIVRAGDTTMALYVVLSGSVRVERAHPDAGAVHLAELGAGGVFGEMGLIDDAVRSATIVALEPTECALIPKWDFEKRLRDNPFVALAIIRVLNGRVRRLEQRLASLSPDAAAGPS